MKNSLLTLSTKCWIIALCCAFSVTAHAQEAQQPDRKIWTSGAARSVFYGDQLQISEALDTVTPSRANSGHVLVDLAVNAAPTKNTFVHGMVRIRNEFGGFWGSGITFDLRQLYVKGLVANSIRYQVGDINYKLSPFTFFNNEEELSGHETAALALFSDLYRYDALYLYDNTWRQQGAAVDFALDFQKGIKEWTFDVFTSRVRPSDFNQQADRIFFGGNSQIIQSDKLRFGVNYIQLTDIAGTARSEERFTNPVVTGTFAARLPTQSVDFDLTGEAGNSRFQYLNNLESPELVDYFMDFTASGKVKKSHTSVGVNYTDVGPNFRSVGAQAKRINFNTAVNRYARLGNDAMGRPIAALDFMQDGALFQNDFSPELDAYSPLYENAQPFGKATPNRRGITASLQQTNAKEQFSVQAEFQRLQEVAGQGTDQVRDFTTISVNGSLAVNKLLADYQKKIELTVGTRLSSTQRTTAFEQADVDWQNNALTFGLAIELINDLHLLLTYRRLTANGNEFIAIRNEFTEVVGFQAIEAELEEQITVAGLRYDFSDQNAINLMWLRSTWENPVANDLPYDINQFSIIYTLKF